MSVNYFGQVYQSGEPNNMQPNDHEPPPQEGDIIVVGRMRQTPWLFQPLVWYGPSWDLQAALIKQRGHSYELYSNVVEAPLFDEGNHEVKIEIYRELTSVEQAAIDRLVGDIAVISRIVSSLSSYDIVRVPGKPDITGAEFKALWAKTDFVIHDDYWKYDNGTQRGEAAYRDGDPQISFNIGTLQSYVNAPGVGGQGGVWVVMHELGHLTGVGRDLNQYYVDTNLPHAQVESERFANDFARSLTEHFLGETVQFTPGSESYSVDHGSIIYYETQSSEPVYSPDVSSWKFDSYDGSGLIPIIA